MSTDPTASEPTGEGEPPSAEPFNLPQTLGKWRALSGIPSGIICILFAVVISAFIYRGTHKLEAPLIILLAFGGFGAMLIVMQLIGFRQLKRYKSPAYTHFQTSTATEYKVPLALKSAVVTYDEAIGSWFGPVNTRGMHGVSVGVLMKEVDNQAINTLLFTNNQVIGLMLGPEDLKNLHGTGRMSGFVSFANTAVQYAGESGVTKGMQFETLNANHWDQMVAALSSQPLEAALQSHLNFGLPYGGIQVVEMENHFVNPGLTFHLKDGSKLRYGSFKRDRLAEISTYLKQFVKVQ